MDLLTTGRTSNERERSETAASKIRELFQSRRTYKLTQLMKDYNASVPEEGQIQSMEEMRVILQPLEMEQFLKFSKGTYADTVQRMA
jgi:hypothetical protein